MPTYDYQCDACNHTFEEFQSFSDPVLKKCPKCKKSKLRRLLGTGAAVIFKGEGFYLTDYRSESYKNAAKADSAAANTATPAESKPAEAKPAESKPADTTGSKSSGSGGKKSKS